VGVMGLRGNDATPDPVIRNRHPVAMQFIPTVGVLDNTDGAGRIVARQLNVPVPVRRRSRGQIF